VIEKDSRLVVHDGNGRLAKAVVELKSEIEAFVGRYKGKINEPEGFWVPTSFMMDYMEFVYWAIKHKDEKKQKVLLGALRTILEIAPQAEAEFWERAVTQKQPKREIIEKYLAK
jgi:hypothetical protein